MQQTFYRNYDAALGRWIAVDPVAESAESMSVYQYAGNNPIMLNDPLGDLLLPEGSYIPQLAPSLEQSMQDFDRHVGLSNRIAAAMDAANNGNGSPVQDFSTYWATLGKDQGIDLGITPLVLLPEVKVSAMAKWTVIADLIHKEYDQYWANGNIPFIASSIANGTSTTGHSAMGGMQLSSAGLAFIQRHEWFGSYPNHKNPYNDLYGFATVGYGHLLHRSNFTKSEYEKYHLMTETDGLSLLKLDINDRVNDVNSLLKVAVTQSQFDTLVDFDFRNGVGNFTNSALLRDINSGNVSPSTIEHDIMQWTLHGNAGGVNRAKAEVQLYNYGIYQ